MLMKLNTCNCVQSFCIITGASPYISWCSESKRWRCACSLKDYVITVRFQQLRPQAVWNQSSMEEKNVWKLLWSNTGTPSSICILQAVALSMQGCWKCNASFIWNACWTSSGRTTSTSWPEILTFRKRLSTYRSFRQHQSRLRFRLAKVRPCHAKSGPSPAALKQVDPHLLAVVQKRHNREGKPTGWSTIPSKLDSSWFHDLKFHEICRVQRKLIFQSIYFLLSTCAIWYSLAKKQAMSIRGSLYQR